MAEKITCVYSVCVCVCVCVVCKCHFGILFSHVLSLKLLSVFYGFVCQSLGWRELETLKEREKEETRRTSKIILKNETHMKINRKTAVKFKK